MLPVLRRRKRMRGERIIWFGLISRNRYFYANRAWGRRLGRWTWGAAILVMSGVNAFSADRAHLDRCQDQLSACYESCKSKGVSPKLCSNSCTTDQCGLPRRESYGAFLDRRIEESAAPVSTSFTGLRRMKGEANSD
jgi:hypothetical protein